MAMFWRNDRTPRRTKTTFKRCGSFSPVNRELNEEVVSAPSPAHSSRRSARVGLLCGLAAYTSWGFIPLYFRAVADVPSAIVLCHRVFWSVLFLVAVVSVRGDWQRLWPVVRNGRNLMLLACGAVLIAINWLIFIYAVGTRQLLQASLGYFINPLLSIALGMLFLRERLRRWQWLAVAIAVIAVINLSLRGAGFPWLALSLAISFAFYGLTRKAVNLNSLHGLMIESAILLPVALFMIGS